MKLVRHSALFLFTALALSACGENPHVDVGGNANTSAIAANQSAETAPKTGTVTATATSTVTAPSVSTVTVTNTNTATVTDTATVTATGSSTAGPTSTVTQTATATVTATATATQVTTHTSTSTVTATTTATATATATATVTATQTNTATATGTSTQPESLGMVNFAFNSAKIRHSEVKTLDAIIDYMRNHADINLDIVGNTSDEGSETYNDSLSRKRAEAVREYLVRAGVEASRLKALAHGEDNPLTPVTPNMTQKEREEAREKNRRVQIFIRQTE